MLAYNNDIEHFSLTLKCTKLVRLRVGEKQMTFYFQTFIFYFVETIAPVQRVYQYCGLKCVYRNLAFFLRSN